MVNIDRKGAGAFGWHFILFSVVFYLFLGMILTTGGAAYLADEITSNDTFSASNYSTNVTNVSINSGNYIQYIWQNPFSSISYLAWLSVSFLIVDIYIIVTSLIP